MTIQARLDQLGQAMRDWRSRDAQDAFTSLNPGLDGLDRHQLIGARAGAALADENDLEPAVRRQQLLADRARAAQQRAEAREAKLEARFVALNPEFGVLPSRTDPDQHRFAQRRERGLALGTRVHLAEARENNGSPELAAWQVRERALRAGRQARDQRQTDEREPAERAEAER